MAFTGTAVQTLVSGNIVRITGLSLAGGASGTIGLAVATGTAPNVSLPAGFQPAPYGNVTLQDAISVELVRAVAGTTEFLIPSVAKTGTDPATFRITIANSSAGSTTPTFELYVKFHE